MTGTSQPVQKKPPAADPLAAFYNDLKAAYDKIVYHDSAGVFAVIVMSAILTVWTWYKYGPTAGAPLLASFFITLAFFV